MTTRSSKALALVGAAALLAWWYRTRTGTVATVTTSEGFDLSMYGGPTSYPEPLRRFAQAIAKQEGFYVAGSIPARAHNPGDLKLPNRPTLPGTSITMFTTDDEGWAALYRQLWLIVTSQSAHYTLDMSIEQMARTWTATEQEPWARNVSSFLGVPTTTPLWQVLA